jgi:HK97 family phage prohead protease
MTSLLDADDFREKVRRGAAPDAGVFKLSSELGEVRDADRTVHSDLSDKSTDLAGDQIEPTGWQLDQFRKNGPLLWSHDASQPPIGKVTGVVVRNGRLVGDLTFAKADEYEFADVIYKLVKGRYLNAVSVGFKPIKYVFSKDPNRPYGIDFITQKLLEVSVCAVPCNENALIQARSAGVDTRLLGRWAERALDGQDLGVLPRRDLEAIRRQAAEPRRGRVARSATADGLNACVDAISDSISASRRMIKDLASANPDGEVDQDMLDQAGGHLRESVARKVKALACVRDALAGASDNSEPNAPTPVAERMAEAARLRPRQRANTPAGRLAEAHELRRICERQEAAREFVRSVAKLR